MVRPVVEPQQPQLWRDEVGSAHVHAIEGEDGGVAQRPGQSSPPGPYAAHLRLARRPRVLVGFRRRVACLLDAGHRPQRRDVRRHLADADQIGVARHVERHHRVAQPTGVPHLVGHRADVRSEGDAVHHDDLGRVQELLPHDPPGLRRDVSSRDEVDVAVRGAIRRPVEPPRPHPVQGRPTGDSLVVAKYGTGLEGALVRRGRDVGRDVEPAAARAPPRTARRSLAWAPAIPQGSAGTGATRP